VRSSSSFWINIISVLTKRDLEVQRRWNLKNFFLFWLIYYTSPFRRVKLDILASMQIIFPNVWAVWEPSHVLVQFFCIHTLLHAPSILLQFLHDSWPVAGVLVDGMGREGKDCTGHVSLPVSELSTKSSICVLFYSHKRGYLYMVNKCILSTTIFSNDDILVCRFSAIRICRPIVFPTDHAKLTYPPNPSTKTAIAGKSDASLQEDFWNQNMSFLICTYLQLLCA